MSETEPGHESAEAQLEAARKVIEKHQAIIDKVDNGVDPEELAKDYDLDTLAVLLNAVGLFFGTSQGEERISYTKRYRVLEKAWRIKAIEEGKKVKPESN